MLKGISKMLLVFGAQADMFGTGINRFSIDFVEIGNPANRIPLAVRNTLR